MPVSLRPFTESDADSLARNANNPAIENWLNDGFPVPYGRADAVGWISLATAEKPYTMLAIDLDGEAIGSIGLYPQTNVLRRNIEMGYWLGEPHWGKGYATRAIKMMTAYAFLEFPDVERVFARAFGNNTGSQRALEKAGFTREARLEKTVWKNGRWEDELFYGIRR